MQRRDLLRAAGAVAGSLALPGVARGQDTRVLRFVPESNVPSLDAVAGTQYVVRNASLLVWDTLYGVDSTLTPKPQMAEGHDVDPEFKTWTFQLRSGLKFHDDEPVLARDCVASLERWMVRDTTGQRIKKQLDALEAVDDRTLRFRLNQSFPKMLFALGKGHAPIAEIMPERIARTDPFKLITEFVGSGPMRFSVKEWMPGSRAVFERFEAYRPREEPGDWIAGGKRVEFDRIEWVVMPDPGTAAAALQNGEVDWWENPLPDLVPLLKQNDGVDVDIADTLGSIGDMRLNHLWPPFNDVRARRAAMMAINQADVLRAMVGDDETLWKPSASFFTPGTPLYSEAGGDLLKGPRDYDAAKALLTSSGYKGEKIVVLVAADVNMLKAEGDVAADALAKAGFNVDYQALDWGTIGARRAKKDPPEKGGWNVFFTRHPGADCVNPAPYTALDASGSTAWFGWPKSDAVQDGITEWYAASGLSAEKTAIAKITQASFENVTFIPTGFFLGHQAWRKNVTGIVKAPFPVFWGVRKT